MTHAGLYTQMGIELARNGNTVEALAYLRHAVTMEDITAEVWLWLAHVTPDPEEYRHCVAQALYLQPEHPTALRMQQDIKLQAEGVPPPVMATQAAQTLDQPHVRRQRGRRIVSLLLAIVVVAACGLFANVALQDVDTDQLRARVPFLQTYKRLQFTVEVNTDPAAEEASQPSEAYRFRVDVPETWFLADEDSPSWVAARNRLQAEFPPEGTEPNRWRALEANLSEITRRAAGVDFAQPVVIIETDVEQVRVSPRTAPQLQLVAVGPSEASDEDACATLRAALPADAQDRDGFIAAEFLERDDATCLYYIHTQTPNDTELEVHTYRIYLTLQDAQEASFIAEWVLRIPETLYDEYAASAERIIASLSSTPVERAE
ncbi:MAG: hypothetical protein ACLFTK_04935 [Anaerolineales bacterium]